MKRINKILFLFVSLLSSISYADDKGDKEGNGGGAVVCVETDGTKTAKLLDLWNVNINPELLAVSKFGSQAVTRFIISNLEKSNPILAALIQDGVHTVRTTVKWTDERLPPPGDTGLKKLNLPENCFLEGAAEYDDFTQTLTYTTRMLGTKGLFDNINQSATEIHEALFKAQRNSDALVSDSKITRATVAELFSSGTIQIDEVNSDLIAATIRCRSVELKNESIEFYVVPKIGKIVFTKMFGFTPFENLSASVPADAFEGVVGDSAIQTTSVLEDQLKLGITEKLEQNPKTQIIPLAIQSSHWPQFLMELNVSRFGMEIVNRTSPSLSLPLSCASLQPSASGQKAAKSNIKD